jgi:hypothetical protein
LIPGFIAITLRAMEFVSPDPNATVRAANVRATLDAFRLLPEVGRRLIEKHDLRLEDLQPDAFIPVQRWLDALREVQTTVGPSKVREVGRHIIANAEFPPHFKDAEEILLELDTIYYLNHQGNVGHYRVSRQASGLIEVRCETPYPRTFEWGLVEGICRHPRARGRYEVGYLEAPTDGDLTCTLKVRRT